MVQTADGDVDLVRATRSFVSERRATRIAKSSKGAGVGLVSMRLASFPFELGTLHHNPRYRLGAGRAPAIFAMAIRADARLTIHRESNFSAVTAAGDHVYFMTQKRLRIEPKIREPDSAQPITTTSYSIVTALPVLFPSCL